MSNGRQDSVPVAMLVQPHRAKGEDHSNRQRATFSGANVAGCVGRFPKLDRPRGMNPSNCRVPHVPRTSNPKACAAAPSDASCVTICGNGPRRSRQISSVVERAQLAQDDAQERRRIDVRDHRRRRSSTRSATLSVRCAGLRGSFKSRSGRFALRTSRAGAVNGTIWLPAYLGRARSPCRHCAPIGDAR